MSGLQPASRESESYRRTQDCRQLKSRKHKKRPICFAAGIEEASSSGVPPAGEATGGLFAWAQPVQSGNRLMEAAESGRTGSAGSGASGRTGAPGTSISPFSRSDLTSLIKNS
eukprot:2094252-Amphidinium_carterae.1